MTLSRILIAGMLVCLLPGCVGLGVVHKTTDTNHCGKAGQTRAEVIANMGREPNAVSGTADKPILSWSGDWLWGGVVVMVGLPIPVLLPYKPGYTHVYFDGEVAQHCEQDMTTWSGGYCGLLNENGRMGCSSLK